VPCEVGAHWVFLLYRQMIRPVYFEEIRWIDTPLLAYHFISPRPPEGAKQQPTP
jgi:hypothetical protein